ncbi:MAG: amidohydrolase family protein [Acidobacteria bacterium]|nr:amidohydrolase family protein [Acidobacteriota bacterium]
MANFSLSLVRRITTRRPWRFAALFLALTALALAFLHTPTAQLDSPYAYAIKDAQIIVSAGKIIRKGTVVIRNGFITDVGENIKIPADARIIEGAGTFVYAGFIDGYTNLGIPAAPPQTPGSASGGNRQAAIAAAQAQPDATHGDPSEAAAEQIKPGGASVEEERSVGVTTALTSSKQGIFAGQSALINLAGDEAAKLVVRAPVSLTVQFSTGRFFGGGYPGSLMGTVAFIRQTFYDAIHYRDEVERYNKTKRGVPRPESDKKLAALQPALRGEMPVFFIANSDNDIRRALQIADEFKLKPIIGGALYGYRLAATLKAKNIPVVLSVDFPQRPSDWPEDEEEPLRVLRARAETPKGAALLAQAGVKFAFTSGSLRPADFLNNIRRAVENGLSKDDALKALTSNAAELFGVGEQLGTIETGKIANLVVLSDELWARDATVKHLFIDGNPIELKKEPPTPPRTGKPGQGAQGTKDAAAEINALGEWELVVKSPQGDMAVKLLLQKDGNNFSGALHTPLGDAALRDISISGGQVRAIASINIDGQAIEATLSGTIAGNSMHGTILLPQIGAFDFTGSKPK